MRQISIKLSFTLAIATTLFSCAEQQTTLDLAPCVEAFEHNRSVDITSATVPYMKTCGLNFETSKFMRDSYAANITVDQSIIDTIYDELEIADLIFTEHTIPYYMIAGTLLGAIRNGGLIPNDDDADVGVDISYESKIDELIPVFDRAGYNCVRDKLGFKIYKKNTNSMGLDVFLTKARKVDGKDVQAYASDWAFAIWPTEWFQISDLANLGRMPFGHLHLNAPKLNDSIAFLDRAYGKDWYAVTYKTYDHINQKQVKAKKEKLLPTEYYHLTHSKSHTDKPQK